MLNAYDKQGGAAIATYRLHRGLLATGLNSQMLVQSKKSDDPNVLVPFMRWKRAIADFRLKLDTFPLSRYKNRQKVSFSAAWLSERLAQKIAALGPDIVHLFWLGDAFFKIETLKALRQPIVWTLHDMWPFTGGCHYDNECGRFQQSCGRCPILHSDRDNDLSRQVWHRKRKSWDAVPITVVATSKWLADRARSSSLFRDLRVEVIPNGIDTDKYKPLDKQAARAAYNLPQDKFLILFSAFGPTSDKRKGGHYLARALEILAQSGRSSDIELVILGVNRPSGAPEFGMTVHYMGCLHDEISQVLLYSAADVLAAPSMQENLSNTVMESLACGTPVVSFNIGGMPDMIDHQENGYLATPFEPDDFARGLAWVIEDRVRYNALSQQARSRAVERYKLETVANRYLALYQSILK
ncbi:MAG: glycosyltransferase family 4 protein [Gallionella sp.]